jgi:hypothetical protein
VAPSTPYLATENADHEHAEAAHDRAGELMREHAAQPHERHGGKHDGPRRWVPGRWFARARRQRGRRARRGVIVTEEHTLLRAAVDEPRRVDEAVAIGQEQAGVVVVEAVTGQRVPALDGEDVPDAHAEGQQPDQ